MAFLHCHNCDWSQDDFWEPNGYNPLAGLENVYSGKRFRWTGEAFSESMLASLLHPSWSK
jgi:hypothetical protein